MRRSPSESSFDATWKYKILLGLSLTVHGRLDKNLLVRDFHGGARLLPKDCEETSVPVFTLPWPSCLCFLTHWVSSAEKECLAYSHTIEPGMEKLPDKGVCNSHSEGEFMACTICSTWQPGTDGSYSRKRFFEEVSSSAIVTARAMSKLQVLVY